MLSHNKGWCNIMHMQKERVKVWFFSWLLHAPCSLSLACFCVRPRTSWKMLIYSGNCCTQHLKQPYRFWRCRLDPSQIWRTMIFLASWGSSTHLRIFLFSLFCITGLLEACVQDTNNALPYATGVKGSRGVGKPAARVLKLAGVMAACRVSWQCLFR